MSSNARKLAIAGAVMHTLMLAAYTFPSQCVPLRLRYWSQAYARVLFHQDWRLFAPDPPACGCVLEVRSTPYEQWMQVHELHHHFIWYRMVANACRFAEASPRTETNDTIVVPSVLSVSLERMVPGSHYEGPPAFRIHGACIARDGSVPVKLAPQR